MGEIGIVVIIANLFGQLRIGVCVMQRRCMGKSSILALVDCGNHRGNHFPFSRGQARLAAHHGPNVVGQGLHNARAYAGNRLNVGNEAPALKHIIVDFFKFPGGLFVRDGPDV